MTKLKFETFHAAFLTAALWCSLGDDGEPLDTKYTTDDIGEASAEVLKAYARIWWYKYSPYLMAIEKEHGRFVPSGYTLDDCAGHDLWLTMWDHGVGFRDRSFYRVTNDVFEPARIIDYSDTFERGAHQLDAVDMYVGDDDKLHI